MTSGSFGSSSEPINMTITWKLSVFTLQAEADGDQNILTNLFLQQISLKEERTWIRDSRAVVASTTKVSSALVHVLK